MGHEYWCGPILYLVGKVRVFSVLVVLAGFRCFGRFWGKMKVLVGLVVLTDFVRFEIVGIPQSLVDSIGLRVCFF